ncbi:response regulator [Bacteroidota bacterium]
MQKILYVDDEPINLQLFKINFRKKYQVLTAIDGFSGLDVLDQNQDTIFIISDMKMPGMSGIDFILKAKEKYPDKKFYILTGFEITNEIRRAIDSGLILQYFSKPFNLIEIDKVLSGVLTAV